VGLGVVEGCGIFTQFLRGGIAAMQARVFGVGVAMPSNKQCAKFWQAGGVMTHKKLLYQTVGWLTLLAMIACWAAVVLILFSHPAAIAQSPQPSFDCSKATTRIESIICSDPELAGWDASLGRSYKREYARLAGNDRQGLIKDQRQWISSRNAQCNQPVLAETKTCIIQSTKSRLAALAQQNGQPLQQTV
jgi:uncharacterized protein YecT (DUF1311 family)